VHRLGHARKAKRLKIAIEKWKNLVYSGTFEKQRPAERRRKQLERPPLDIGRQFRAEEQQTELIFPAKLNGSSLIKRPMWGS